jgi:hypothetical protein
MSSRFLAAVCVALAVAIAGCRMADGPLPTPNNEDLNRLDDLRRDVGNVVAGHPDAKKDFADDLQVFVRAGARAEAPPAVNELARLISDAAVTAQLKETAVSPLLRQVWTALVARELSEKQIATLRKLAVPEPSAQAISSQIVVVQKAVTDRQRRWYEVF